jgi:hypothetical protein
VAVTQNRRAVRYCRVFQGLPAGRGQIRREEPARETGEGDGGLSQRKRKAGWVPVGIPRAMTAGVWISGYFRFYGLQEDEFKEKTRGS